MHYSIEQLEAFIATVELGSFSAAARKLGKVQSAVSMAVQNLEIDLAVTLFDRNGHTPKLTTEGEALLYRAYDILQSCKKLSEYAQILQQGAESRICLAMDEITPIDYIETSLTAFAKKYSDVEIELMFVGLNNAIDQLLADEAVFAILPFIDDIDMSALLSKEVGQIKFVAAAWKEHPLHELKEVNADDLRHHRQIVISGQSNRRFRAVERLSSQIWLCNSHYLMLDMLRGKLGWGFVPEHLLDNPWEGRELKAFSLGASLGDFTIPILLCWKKEHTFGLAGRYLHELLAKK